MTTIACDLCGSAKGSTLFESGERRFGLPGRFAVVRCARCGLARTEPQPDDPGAYYPAGDYYSFAAPAPSPLTRAAVRSTYGLSVGGGRWQRTAARVAAKRISALPPGPPGELLDVGSGSGSMLLALEEAGWRCHGVEIDEGAVRAANAAGLSRVRAGDLLDAGYREQSFDAVRFSHSLEHVSSPRAQLVEARRVLRTGGRLVLAVPNFASLISRLARSRWFFLDLPRHLWHFDSRTLATMVTESGFSVDRVRNVTASSAILGTADDVLGRGERLLKSPRAWYVAQPLAALLDLAHLGDELELTATARRD